MNIIRRYKIHLLKYDALTEKELTDLNTIFKSVKYCKENEEVINFIYNNLLNLKQVKLYNYPDYIMYFNDKNENIFQQSLKSNYLYTKLLIWSVFKDEFGYNGQETRKLIKGIVEQAYKLSGITTDWQFSRFFNIVEEVYKQQNEYNKTI